MNGITLYHKEIFMPASVREILPRKVTFRVTEHAKQAALSDRYGVMTIPAEITFRGKNVIEAEFINGVAVKFVVRKPYDETRDAVYAFLMDGTLKTVWFNLKTDCHRTLKKELYARG